MKNINGLTIIESIVALGVLGIVVVPIMSMFVLSASINHNSRNTFNSLLTAQRYMEEAKAMEVIDPEKYVYNPTNGCYERNVLQTVGQYGAVIKISAERNLLYKIEVEVLENGVIIDSFNGSKIIK